MAISCFGFVSFYGRNTCVGFGRIFDWAPIGICHARVGDGGICSPDTVTCPKKNAAHAEESSQRLLHTILIIIFLKHDLCVLL